MIKYAQKQSMVLFYSCIESYAVTVDDSVKMRMWQFYQHTVGEADFLVVSSFKNSAYGTLAKS
jgi:hypothetical protein